jgi:hypothetical protein
LLDRWAFDRTIGAEHTTISRSGFKQDATLFAVIIELAGIGWQGFGFRMPAMGTGNGRFQDHAFHGFCFAMVDGNPAPFVAAISLSVVVMASSNGMVAVLAS